MLIEYPFSQTQHESCRGRLCVCLGHYDTSGLEKEAIHEAVRIRSVVTTDTPAVSTETDVCLRKEEELEWTPLLR